MSNLTFPPLQNTPLLAFSPLLTHFLQEVSPDGQLYDIATLASEYLAQNKLFADSSEKAGMDYRMLEERSELLQKWVVAIETVFINNVTQFDEKFKQDDFKNLLRNMKRVYAYPLLTSLWLGLEHVSEIRNCQEDTALYHRIQASLHYPNEVIDECVEVLTELNTYGDNTSLIHFLQAAQTNTPVTKSTMEIFIAQIAPIVFRLGASGRQQLTIATLTMLNHTLTWLDNRRMNQSYQTVLSHIKRVRKNLAVPKEPIYATNPPIFDAHIPCSDTRIKVDDPIYATGAIVTKTQPVGNEFFALYEKLKANLELIVEYRGRRTQARTHQFLIALNAAMTSSETAQQKARYCQCLIADWQRWMIVQFGDKDVLMNECGSLGAAIVAKIADSKDEQAYG